MIAQLYFILTSYRFYRDSGTPDEQELIGLAVRSGVKFLRDYLAGKFDTATGADTGDSSQ